MQRDAKNQPKRPPTISEERQILTKHHHTTQGSIEPNELTPEKACRLAAQRLFELAADLRQFAPRHADTAQEMSDLLVSALAKAGLPDPRTPVQDRMPLRDVRRFVPAGQSPNKLPIIRQGQQAGGVLAQFAPEAAKEEATGSLTQSEGPKAEP